MTDAGRMARTAVVVVALLAPRPGHAQSNRWEHQVADQLRRAVATLGDQSAGRGRPELSRIAPFNDEESESFTAPLQAGVPYAVIGVCDNDCTSLHLVLANAANSEVAADRASENVPVLHFTPPETARYRVKVTMAACQMNPCWYGVAVYRR